jgi:hypothetical protein
MKILDITTAITPSINILPNGTMDPTKSHWCFGGPTFNVATDRTIFSIQMEKGVWYSPDYGKSNGSLLALITEIDVLDLELEEYYRTH